MNAILAILYGVFLTLVGVRGNGIRLAGALSQEGQFVYWVLVLLVVAALWETETGAQVARPLAFLIVVGFLLRNWQTIANNARAAMPTAPITGGGK